MKKAVECRCGRYLLKPAHPEFLFEQISSLLHQKVSRRDIPLAQATATMAISVSAHLPLTLEADEPYVPAASVRQRALSNLG